GRLTENLEIGVKNHNKIKGKNNPVFDNIIDSDVIDIYGNSLALSKNDFADNILNKNERYLDLDFSAFEELFETIREIINS
ncbi:hypothetical protein LJR17_004380, partial [Salmonella enterica]|nr:hypothetical protein [Salmonella enterica]EIJ9350741.1 hypothetical protein [Salmonella enterica]